MLRIQLLGGFQCTHDGRPVPGLEAPRLRSLLAYLLLHLDPPTSRQQLAFLLWPDSNEAQARTNLRKQLHQLRELLPEADRYLAADTQTVQWRPDSPFRLDVFEFNRAVSQARTAAEFSAAVDLYGGELLPGCYDEWILPERDHLRQAQFNALRRLAAHHRAAGEFAPAIEHARRALSIDPLSETAARDLVSLHYLGGDRSAALAEYDRLRVRLRDSLDVEPMDESRALIERIGRGERLHDAQAVWRLPAPVEELPRLIGRQAELAQLAACWDETVAGRGRMVIVSGEAGVGKSHLAAHLARYAMARGGLSFTGHCYEFEGTLPYQALAEILRAASGRLGGLNLAPAHRSALARLVPGVIEAPQEPMIVVSPDDLRAELMEGLLQAFQSLAESRPLLLLFEDVHWAGESTLDWLAYVTPRLRQGRLMTVITYRTGEGAAHESLSRLVQRFEREGALSAVPLGPLSLQANRELVAQLSGLEPSSAERVADRLFMETAGNPFFLLEIAQDLIESRQIVPENGRWSGAFVRAAPDVDVPLPESLRETLAARVNRLTEISRMFARSAAVAGRAFDYEIVRHAGGWSDELGLQAIEDLLKRGFVRETETDGWFVFSHHLISEALYADLAAPRRIHLHRQLAGALRTLRPQDFESLAYHHGRAGDHDQARLYSVRAGDRARSQLAMKDAAEHYRLALDTWPASDAAGRAEVLDKLGRCCWVIFETQKSLEAFEAARSLYESLGNTVNAGEMERQIGRMYWELGDRAASLLHFQRALDILEQGPETVELARAVSSISQMHMLASENEDAIAWGERALALAERLGAPDVTVHSLNNVGVALLDKPEAVERGLAMLQESLRLALELGLPHDVCRAYINMNEQLLGLCRYAEARAGFEAMLAYARRVYARAFAGDAARRLTDLDWWTGNWGSVLTRWQLILEYTWGIWQVRTSQVFGHIYNDLGRPEEALRELESTLPQAIKWGEIQTVAPHLGKLARAYAALSLESETGHTLQRLLEVIDNNRDLHWESTMHLLFACQWYAVHPGSLDAARACLRRLERARERFITQETGSAVAEACGAVSLAEGDFLQAAREYRRAAEGWQALGRPYDQARALGGLGRALDRARETGPAGSAFDQAAGIIDSLAAQLDDGFKQTFLNSQFARELRGA